MGYCLGFGGRKGTVHLLRLLTTVRYQKLDALRGIALLGMILFHTHYIVENVFGDMAFHFFETFWFMLGRIVAIIFIFVSGISFFLFTEKRNMHQIFQKGLKRFLILAVIALLISLVTYLFFYEQRISFGIIHFFALASLAGLFFVKYTSWNILIGASLLLLGQYIQYFPSDTYFFVPFGVYPQEYYSADYYPLIPWLGYYLIGFGMASLAKKQGVFDTIFFGTFFGSRPLAFLGKHALFFYVIHVPVIYSVLRIVYGV